jgi:hypothetical protein
VELRARVFVEHDESQVRSLEVYTDVVGLRLALGLPVTALAEAAHTSPYPAAGRTRTSECSSGPRTAPRNRHGGHTPATTQRKPARSRQAGAHRRQPRSVRPCRLPTLSVPAHRLDVTRMNERLKIIRLDPHITSDANEGDPTTGDEATYESDRCAESIRDLLHR